MNNSFVFYESWYEVLEDERQEVQWEVIHAIMEYVFRDNLIELKPNAKMAFKFIKRDIDRAKVNYSQFIEKQRENGAKGGRPTKSHENPKNPVVFSETQKSLKENVKEKEKENVEYKYSFVKITDFADTLKNFSLNKSYLFIAYRFWQLWWKDNQTKTLRDAIVINWYNSIRMIIENDKQSIERLLVVYFYFERCQQQEAGFDTFWFENIKSVSAFRKKDRDGVYYLDKIMEKINSKLAKDEDFDRFISKKIKEFKEYEIAKLHKKQS